MRANDTFKLNTERSPAFCKITSETVHFYWTLSIWLKVKTLQAKIHDFDIIFAETFEMFSASMCPNILKVIKLVKIYVFLSLALSLTPTHTKTHFYTCLSRLFLIFIISLFALVLDESTPKVQKGKRRSETKLYYL
jgi:hypothetical protein